MPQKLPLLLCAAVQDVCATVLAECCRSLLLTQAELLADCALEHDQAQEEEDEHHKGQVGKPNGAQVGPCVDLCPGARYCSRKQATITSTTPSGQPPGVGSSLHEHSPPAVPTAAAAGACKPCTHVRGCGLTFHCQMVLDGVLETVQHKPAQQTEERQGEAEGTHKAIPKAWAALCNRLPAGCSMRSSSNSAGSTSAKAPCCKLLSPLMTASTSHCWLCAVCPQVSGM